ncbi:MAG: 4Fe-4S binding protein [Candidatus Lokiarchaeota archaeon]|nr:4Fe-4S binding protein [Candidatus Lokiarchaeota archaeon]
MDKEHNKVWYKAALTIIKAGQLPMVVNDDLIELLRLIMTDEQAEFITVFRKPSLSIDQLKDKTNLDEEALTQTLNALMDNGIIVGVLSRRSGIMVYRLLGPFPGLFEMQFMRGETGEKQKKLAQIFDNIFKELSKGTQNNYENIVEQYKNYPPITRVVPVEEEIKDVPVDKILPYEEASRIVEKYDDIALVHCYCRHEKDLLEHSCSVTNERLNCFLLGKSAQFAIKHNFGKSISKKDAKSIINNASDEGLVHKAFHVHLKPELDEEALCNCCRCCCGIFSLFWEGISPYHCYTSYLAEVDEDSCVGCGTCVKKCPMEAIDLVENIASINSSRCIGCGVCVHHCPEEAMKLKRTGNREVFVPPPKIKTT